MNSKNHLSFGEIMNRERNERNLSFNDLAKIMSQNENEEYRLSSSYLSRIANNKYDNPSINNVLTITEALSLDLKEVIKSFGFMNLIDTDTKWEINSIEELIRNGDIMAPLDNSYLPGYTSFQYLDNEEKEILIDIVNSTFAIGICDEEHIFLENSKISQALGRYRRIRIKKNKEKYLSDDIFESLDMEYEITFTKKAKERIYKSQSIKPDRVATIIYDNRSSIYNTEGTFDLKDKQNLVLIHLNKIEDIIVVVDITEQEY